MSPVCGLIFDNGISPPKDPDGCRLQDGHEGAHEFVETYGQVIQWETDFECDCEWCQSCQGDYCMIYWNAEDETRKCASGENAPG